MYDTVNLLIPSTTTSSSASISGDSPSVINVCLRVSIIDLVTSSSSSSSSLASNN